MATPFKRICLRATRAPIPQRRPSTQCRPFSSATPAQASQDTSHDDNAYLDTLASQPGVEYTSTESPEDLRKLGATEMSSLAHRELEQHRELREMVRLAAWEMPLLSQLSKPFEKPKGEQVLRWRYTTYLGESHPAARKVVVDFKPGALPDLNQQQREKLLKLAGPRYNPGTKTIKMSCESFETQAQNKRYLADTVHNLIAEATDPKADSFSDIPLDTRHHKAKKVFKFPDSWIMTPERRAQLEEKRTASMLEDGKKVEEDKLVSGLKAIEEARKIDAKKTEQPIMAEARQPLPRGKMGKKEMGQQRGANR
ncbi:37S ribosomal protein S24, mitochondrial [Vermiconidia calcicola]|uniref:37S ribosomal protein S24, mitochondrial n=1 Tax=Vermiconidia calcicola TaxID=1690605 RepID=A0ACC3MCJ6_9PEZI|nr:37S ribosomal protein S24, mitochondrial [Vermiconidia calcicola]